MQNFGEEFERLRQIAVKKGIVVDEGPSNIEAMRDDLRASGITEEHFIETMSSLVEGDVSDIRWQCPCGHQLVDEPSAPPFKCNVEGCTCEMCSRNEPWETT
jgi:hypothetical protein